MEYCEPSFIEVLRDALAYIQEGILGFIDIVLDHLRNDVVRLVELELELLAESQKAKRDDTENDHHANYLPRVFTEAQRLRNDTPRQLVHEKKRDKDGRQEVHVVKFDQLTECESLAFRLGLQEPTVAG